MTVGLGAAARSLLFAAGLLTPAAAGAQFGPEAPLAMPHGFVGRMALSPERGLPGKVASKDEADRMCAFARRDLTDSMPGGVASDRFGATPAESRSGHDRLKTSRFRPFRGP